MANRSVPLVLAGLTGVCMLVGAGAAQAAPPRCENITVDDLRQACIDRVERCEPLKSATERAECYRGRAPKSADGAASGPIKLTPKAASPAPSAAPVSPVPVSPVPVSQMPVSPVPVSPGQTPPPPAPPPPASTAVVVRPGQPPAMATPAPIPQPAPKVDPAQVSPPLPTIVRPAPSPAVPAAPPAAIIPPPRPTPGDGLDAVRGFYQALAQADGVQANEFLVPEKRNSGAYEIASMSRYYGNMREPVRLIAAEPMGNDVARVRYHYVYANGRLCDGAAEVFLSRRDGRTLIERIRALNGC